MYHVFDVRLGSKPRRIDRELRATRERTWEIPHDE